ncbi:MAG: threonine--tRNA ligase [Clostridiales Family XIII bacterium]|jgi:threonyl-tRNA synthetase|nr:threonine--tRNA ligase [Clostridiales Family XIII bacterium]
MAEVKINQDADEGEALSALRHTTSHVLAQAVKRLWPEAQLAIGPSIADGFYYDFDLPHRFAEEDLAAIEKEMKKIVKAGYKLEYFELSRPDALKWADEAGEPYKRELIEGLGGEQVLSFYKMGEFADLCKGPHIESTGKIKAFKLLSVAGAYWRGNEKNKMLQRIYGTAFPTREELDAHLARIEEAKRRDHRRIGREMDLFMIVDEGPGFPFFLPNGMAIRNELENFWREEHRKRGYTEIRTPIILNESLWHTSGHWDHYQDNMYFTKIDGDDFAIKPMNCPGAMLTYKRKPYSYRDFPIRLAELGQVHRHELSGALHGLMRVRTFTQDDAHIFMLPEQIGPEIKGVIEFIGDVYKMFGFKYHVELSTRPEGAMGSREEWDTATEALRAAVCEMGIPYIVNEGDGAFYGPKIDFHLEDSIGRTWQCGTVQLDFQMPQRFGLAYVGPDGEKHVPTMIHRVIFGSIERFIAILTEHFAGKFPLWLAPVQVKFLTVSTAWNPCAEMLAEGFRLAGLRAEADLRNEKIGYKIREARNARDSYLVVIGEKEAGSGLLPVRSSKQGELGEMDAEALKAMLLEEIRAKAV